MWSRILTPHLKISHQGMTVSITGYTINSIFGQQYGLRKQTLKSLMHIRGSGHHYDGNTEWVYQAVRAAGPAKALRFIEMGLIYLVFALMAARGLRFRTVPIRPSGFGGTGAVRSALGRHQRFPGHHLG